MSTPLRESFIMIYDNICRSKELFSCEYHHLMAHDLLYNDEDVR